MKKIVYISPLKWSSYSQRPHFMMRHLAEVSGLKILWVDPFPVRLPQFSDISRRRDVYNQGTEYYPGIEVYSHSPIPIEPLANCQILYQKLFLRKHVEYITAFIDNDVSALGIGKPCCLAKVLLDSAIFDSSFYDAMDDYPEFHTGISRSYVATIESYIASNVDEVLVSSHFLQKKFSPNNKTSLIQNGYDDSFVLPSINTVDPALKEHEKKVIGYVGTIYHWFDWDLVISIAVTAPAATIKLIGPVLGKIPSKLPLNIVILPPCANEDAMKHMRTFDVGLIPFLRNNATRAVDPIKYYEYRALNLPVISTLFGDMQYKLDDPGLFIVPESGDQNLNDIIRSAFGYHASPEDFKLRTGATWTSRFKNADILSGYLKQT